MTPVYQTIKGLQGNCFEACIASILDLPLDVVPRLCDEWAKQLRQWRPSVVFFPGNKKALAEQVWYPVGYAIVSQRVPKTGGIHATVCFDGEIVHDPSHLPFSHPSYPVELWTILGEKRC